MALEIMRDERVRSIEWQDLCQLSKGEIIHELLISAPWLALSLLRQVHNAFHYALGLSKKGHEYFLFLFSIIMLGSLHAVQFNHLRHHRYCMNEEDVEARSARMKWWQAILFGPKFPILLHHTALKLGSPRLPRCCNITSSSC